MSGVFLEIYTHLFQKITVKIGNIILEKHLMVHIELLMTNIFLTEIDCMSLSEIILKNKFAK
jgi:hypothetical protein